MHPLSERDRAKKDYGKVELLNFPRAKYRAVLPWSKAVRFCPGGRSYPGRKLCVSAQASVLTLSKAARFYTGGFLAPLRSACRSIHGAVLALPFD